MAGKDQKGVEADLGDSTFESMNSLDIEARIWQLAGQRAR